MKIRTSTMHYREVSTNYYARKEQLKEEFLTGLQQKRIDAKFQYVGKRQANAWFNLCNSPEYDYYRESRKLLESTVNYFVSDHKGDVNVIALGPGNALKEKIIVERFQQTHQVSLFFVDISKEVLNVAIENVDDPNVLKEIFIADLMNFVDIKELSHYVKDQYNATNFFTLLGNTFGNYPQGMILKTIRNAMTPGDKILIDVHVMSAGSIESRAWQIDEMIRSYSNPSSQQRVVALLSDAGIEQTDGAIDVEFSTNKLFPQMDVVERYFRFERSKIITYQREDIYFAKGERILVGYSNKYTFECLENILTSHGLCIVKDAQDDTGKYHQILCELR